MARNSGSLKSATLMSLTLHAAIVAAMMLSVDLWGRRAPIAVAQNAIEAVVVDQSVVERQIERIRENDRAAIEAREREVREEREREERRLEAERVERERERQRLETARLEQERVAREAEIALQQQREEEERRRLEAEEAARREAEEAARRERERLEELERQREEAARLAREAEEARQREQMERELQAALAAEEEQRIARESGEYDRYIQQIRNRIEANWFVPASSQEGVECTVHVTQIRSGDVTSVSIGQCNGDAALRNSLEAAVLRASPLPLPSIPSLFDREVTLVLRPDR